MIELNDNPITLTILNGVYEGVNIQSSWNNSFDDKIKDLNAKFDALNIPINVYNVEKH